MAGVATSPTASIVQNSDLTMRRSSNHAYFELSDQAPGWGEEGWRQGQAWLRRRTAALQRRTLASFAAEVGARGHRVRERSDSGLIEAAAALRVRMLRSGVTQDTAAEAFALVCEACVRQIGLRPYPVQVMGAAAMLRRTIAEMQTGEGKTLTATMTAATFALAGRPVHLVTVNDYLAERDHDHLQPIYTALGLSTGLIRSEASPDERRKAYAADIVYCTNKDLVFDYLRDRLALGSIRQATRRDVRLLMEVGSEMHDSPLLLRGLHVAIVDEADSVLIDEARTPLILSGPDRRESTIVEEQYQEALELARALCFGRDWRIDHKLRAVSLTAHGQAMVATRSETLGGLWRIHRARDELVARALAALHLFHNGIEYVLSDGKVQIVDEFTGRLMPDRTWEFGLHQMIEAKERLDVTGPKVTMARMTFQRFFRRYWHLAGMTGTASQVAGEMAATYDVDMLRIPTNRPNQRVCHGQALFHDAARKWQAVLSSAQRSSAVGRPVLIGTRSVATSNHVSALLAQKGIVHTVLNAVHDQDEARIVGQAGQEGRVTVATNMAGRGTDIRLDATAREKGGLHVILTEYHESARVDRQLFGRSGRQGDPGGYECFASLEDEIFERFSAKWLLRAATAMAVGRDTALPSWIAFGLKRLAQTSAGATSAKIRRDSLRHDRSLSTLLAFAGDGE